MAWVTFKTPTETVSVNTDQIFSAEPNLDTPGDDVDLWWNAARQTLVIEPFAAVVAKLGADFVGFDVAGVRPNSCVVNRKLVISVIPHPQVPDVCFLQGAVRRTSVKGDLESVTRKLGG